MILTSVIYLIKGSLFEVFYYLHVFCFALIFIIAFIHGAAFFGASGIVWGADLLLRYVITLKRIQAQAILLPGGVVKLQFKKCFDYAAGQYCFVMIKTLDRIAYHSVYHLLHMKKLLQYIFVH